jgi:hypothetical protein
LADNQENRTCDHRQQPLCALLRAYFEIMRISKIEGRKQSQSNLNPGVGDCIWREPCFHQRGFCKPKDMLLIKPDAAEQVLKPRVAAHGIEEGVYFEPLQDSRLLFVGLVAPEECVIVIVERQVRSNKGT